MYKAEHDFHKSEPKIVISRRCSSHVEKIMADEAKDFELDPQLAKNCKECL